MCNLFNLSKRPGWEKRCSSHDKTNSVSSSYGKSKAIEGIEINCNVLCRIGQGGNACKCA